MTDRGEIGGEYRDLAELAAEMGAKLAALDDAREEVSGLRRAVEALKGTVAEMLSGREIERMVMVKGQTWRRMLAAASIPVFIGVIVANKMIDDRAARLERNVKCIVTLPEPRTAEEIDKCLR